MPSRALRLLASLLFVLTLTQARAHAEAPHFATGFLIYKAVKSDVPAYYNGALFISSSAIAIWKEYDVGQTKPFRIESGLVVSEIKFGALFSADFTTDQHVEFCQGVQAQLAAAAAQSPKLKAAAMAASASIQAEVDHYRKEEVRFRGKWITRLAYQDILAEEERQRAVAMVEKKAIDDKVKADAAAMWEAGRQKRMAQEAYEAEEKVRRNNLAYNYSAESARYLASEFDSFMTEAAEMAQAGRALRVTLAPDEKAIGVPRHPNVGMELRTNLEGTENEMSMLCAYDQNSRLVAMDIVFFLVSDSTRQNLVNKAEVDAARAIVGKFEEGIFGMLPEILSAANITRVLRKDRNINSVAAYDAQISNIEVAFGVGAVAEYSGSKFRQMVMLRIRPTA